LQNWRKAGPAARPPWKVIAAIFVAAAWSVSASPAVRAAAPTGVTLGEQWFRFITPTIPAAGYFTLSNATATPQALVGASSPDCGSLMLHQSVTKNGVEQMIMVPKVAIPAHGTLQFSPGGYHLMCMSPAAAMRPGQSVPVTLQFEGGASLSADFPVRGATGR
jgi:periplasmic copper chaperone A